MNERLKSDRLERLTGGRTRELETSERRVEAGREEEEEKEE